MLPIAATSVPFDELGQLFETSALDAARAVDGSGATSSTLLARASLQVHLQRRDLFCYQNEDDDGSPISLSSPQNVAQRGEWKKRMMRREWRQALEQRDPCYDLGMRRCGWLYRVPVVGGPSSSTAAVLVAEEGVGPLSAPNHRAAGALRMVSLSEYMHRLSVAEELHLQQQQQQKQDRLFPSASLGKGLPSSTSSSSCIRELRCGVTRRETRPPSADGSSIPFLEVPFGVETKQCAFALSMEGMLLNAGSYGATPSGVLRAVEFWELEQQRNPASWEALRLPRLMHTIGVLSEVLGCDPTHLALVPNCNTATSVVLKSLPWEAGDRMVVFSCEYDATLLALQYLTHRFGVLVDIFEVSLPFKSASSLVRMFYEYLAAKQKLEALPKVVNFCHVTSRTATMFPAKELVAVCHEFGVLAVVDGAHVPGHLCASDGDDEDDGGNEEKEVEVATARENAKRNRKRHTRRTPYAMDIQRIGADVYCGTFHKWLASSQGLAFLVVPSPHMQALLQPLVPAAHTLPFSWEAQAAAASLVQAYKQTSGTAVAPSAAVVPTLPPYVTLPNLTSLDRNENMFFHRFLEAIPAHHVPSVLSLHSSLYFLHTVCGGLANVQRYQRTLARQCALYLYHRWDLQSDGIAWPCVQWAQVRRHVQHRHRRRRPMTATNAGGDDSGGKGREGQEESEDDQDEDLETDESIAERELEQHLRRQLWALDRQQRHRTNNSLGGGATDVTAALHTLDQEMPQMDLDEEDWPMMSSWQGEEDSAHGDRSDGRSTTTPSAVAGGVASSASGNGMERRTFSAAPLYGNCMPMVVVPGSRNRCRDRDAKRLMGALLTQHSITSFVTPIDVEVVSRVETVVSGGGSGGGANASFSSAMPRGGHNLSFHSAEGIGVGGGRARRKLVVEQRLGLRITTQIHVDLRDIVRAADAVLAAQGESAKQKGLDEELDDEEGLVY